MLAAAPLSEPALDATDLIAVWEAATAEPLPARTVLILERAWPGYDWLRTPIGIRDRWLFRLRECLFGGTMPATASCPACSTQLELELRTADLIAEVTEPPPAGLVLRQTDLTVRYRLPDTLDVLTAAAVETESRAAILLGRCIVDAERNGISILPDAISTDIRAAIVAAMEAADPQADARLALSCPGCGHEWTAPFDIGAYLWDDIEECARRLLRQVHDIAQAYGWTEDTILSLSARRRRFYLEAIVGVA